MNSGTAVDPSGWRLHSRRALPSLAFLAAAGLLALSVIAPNPGAAAAPVVGQAAASGPAQTLVVARNVTPTGPLPNGVIPAGIVRDNYTITVKAIARPVAKALGAPAAGIPNPGSAQAIGHALVLARGWGESEYSCLVSLFNRESGWRVNASNPSGAYGIPQALPGSKMASVGADWQTNPATQITWGLNYIAARYGTPCGAWAHSQSSGWY
ncbi:MAG: hypothetical protein QOD27_642 [Microbacteriaceae bacterium]|nr:hypothetical protein [Microbacteriaceae bacterium]MDQ1548984.1 hypothetical protein [Microbacteriaceae bacterium]